VQSYKRLFIAGAVLMVIVLAATLLYEAGMAKLEGKPRTFWQSFGWATETLSTTGYGSDSQWHHPAMVLLAAVVQFVGVVSVPLLVALLLVPFLAQQFEARVPRRAPENLNNHVIVYRFSPVVESLLQKLKASNVPSIVVELDEQRARAVMETQQAVVFTRAEEDALDAARLNSARAIVANGTDQENAALVLRARQSGFKGVIYAFVEDPAHRKAMELAGATAVYTPRHIVAAALAAHASDTLSPRLPGLEQIRGIVRREVRVSPAGPAAGRTIGDVRIPAVIAGQWHRSHLQSRCTPTMRIEPSALLDLVGTPESIEQSAEILGAVPMRQEGFFLVAGFGEVGRKVRQLLVDAGEEVRVVERIAAPDVDVVGDVLDSSVLERAGVAECRSLILALDSDDATLFAAVIARDAAPDIPVIARVNHARNLDNIHRAGADYALSISDISGDMLYAKLLGGSTRIREEHRRVTRMHGSELSGRSVSELQARHEGISVLAIETDGEVRLPAADALIRGEDEVWLCGSAEALRAAQA
jgi:Trk K+ transport system NAD-binding subunit